MKSVKLKHKDVRVYFDDEDWERISQYTWYLGKDGYAIATIRGSDGKKHTLRMSRLIMDCPKDMQVDHRDHNINMNTKSNLRICTHAENMHNQKLRLGGSSRFKGVCYQKSIKRWYAQIQVNGKNQKHLGSFRSEINAALAYDRMARKHFGRFAFLNFPTIESISEGQSA